MENKDNKTIKSFEDEWKKYDQLSLSNKELKDLFNKYFDIFPWHLINSKSEGVDFGSGSGRWAYFIAKKVGVLNCIEPSAAIEVSKKKLKKFNNIRYIKSSLDASNLKKSSQDFGFSLGVLHHIPNTQQAIKSCSNLLKPGAPFLLYLYYSFDNRPIWYKAIWQFTNLLRMIISIFPSFLKNLITNLIAFLVYLPLAKLCNIIELIGFSSKNIPLSFYKNSSFYTMRTDSRDRFGTPLEKRFSKKEIQTMMEDAGFKNIKFSKEAPYWCAVGIKI